MAVHSRYKELAAQIEARIKAGEWEPGSKLPRLDDFAAEYGANRDTIGRAISHLEQEGLVWAIQGSGIIVRYGTIRPRRPRGSLVKRNIGTGQPGYSFPSATGQEVWKHHVTPVTGLEPLNDPRLAKMLGVPVGGSVMRRFRVTGPRGEPPFQINTTWIHPRGLADAPEVTSQAPGPGDWLYRLEKAGHWPISWMEVHRARMPSKDEARLLQIPTGLPVLEIVRVGTSGLDGQPIEVTEYVVASDRVETVHVLHRDESAQGPWPDESTEEAPQGAGASATLRLDAAARTNIGLVRRRNEDALYAGRWLFAVADGLGGHVAGDVASTTAIEALRAHDRHMDSAELEGALGQAVNAANEGVRRKVEADPDVAGMGTTLVALMWSETTAVLANVGDSRAYLVRANDADPETVQITEDHVYGNLLAEADSGLSERLTRFIDGRADGRSPDITRWELRAGDRFLLCTDGLSSVVPHEEIHDALTSLSSPAEAAERLVEAAINHGGPDNVTVLVLDVRDESS